MKIAIIGQGYVGLTLAAFASESNTIVGFDRNKDLVLRLNKGKSHIEGISNELLSKKLQNGSYFASSEAKDISDVEAVIIAVPTPLTTERKPDLTYLKDACVTIGKYVENPS